jgi:H+/Cl- antiporter ClcA
MQIESIRSFLSDYRAVLPYALLGIIAGICSATVIILFDLLLSGLSSIWLAEGSPNGFESLPRWMHFALPVAGAAALGLIFTAIAPEQRETGIVHVLSRMHSHYGRLPMRNALVQFLGGAAALSTGLSGGREGPGVHLGAAVNSNLAVWLGLPNNSQRVLIACGTAASIAVAFDTPLAGIIFAMEVIVMEYSVVGFTPVILAAVSATALNRSLDAGGALFALPPVHLESLAELPAIVLLGFVAGAVIAGFITLLRQFLKLGQWPVFARFAAAGVATGGTALLVPEVMGLSYDTISDALAGQLAPALLLTLVACKLLATAAAVGLGLPVGLIGPSLVIGACLGGAIGHWGNQLLPALSSDPALYVAIGMGAAMAAVLNAPLAALLAVVELTQTVNIVFPAMLAIIAATLTNTILFRQRSAHQTVLAHLQRSIPDDPISLLLHQTSVVTAMEVGVRAVPATVDAETLASLRQSMPTWCLLKRDDEKLYLVRGSQLSEVLEGEEHEEGCILTELDLRRWSVAALNARATLQEALDTMRRQTVEAVLVTHSTTGDVLGVLTRDTIDQFYLRRL